MLAASQEVYVNSPSDASGHHKRCMLIVHLMLAASQEVYVNSPSDASGITRGVC